MQVFRTHAPLPEQHCRSNTEHLRKNLELTGKLRQAVEQKITGASATELERLGGALEAVGSAERTLLELTPRTAKNKAPSLRPREPEYGSREWRRKFDAEFEAVNGLIGHIEPAQPATTDPGQPSR